MQMKVIVAGSRNITNPKLVEAAIEKSGFIISEVVCGMAEGADALGRAWAQERGVPVKEFPADWKRFGKSAGPRRNTQMANYADALIAVWVGASRGTQDMVLKAIERELKVSILYVCEECHGIVEEFLADCTGCKRNANAQR